LHYDTITNKELTSGITIKMSLSILPTEIVERILLSPCLNYQDVVHFSETCLRLSTISESNEVWHQLFRSQYRTIYGCLKESSSHQKESLIWKKELIRRLQIGQKLDKYIKKMSPKFFHQTELSSSDFTMVDSMFLEHNPQFSFIHLYALDHLRSLKNDDKAHENLTNKYYGLKVARHIQQRLLEPDIRDFVEENNNSSLENKADQQVLYENMLVLIAQWCQPILQINRKDVSSNLDTMAEKIFSNMNMDRVGDKKVESALDLKIVLKDVYLKQKIFEATNQYLKDEGYKGNTHNYYNAENSFINKVIETKFGIPISLSLMYLALLGRLGITCEPVNFPRHFLLRWNENSDLGTAPPRYSYIDVFNGGKQMSRNEALAMIGEEVVQPENVFEVANPISSAQRMMRNLISIGASQSNNMRDSSYSLLRSALEFMLLINVSDVPDFAFMLSRVYIQLNINHEKVVELLSGFQTIPGLSQQAEYLLSTSQMQNDEKANESTDITPKKRDGEFPLGEVRLRVGTIAKHMKYDYKCVVYGWDTQCTASRSWIHQMGVDRLSRKDKQPFYNVLVEDGSSRYAADENLEMCSPCPIQHSEIGKYFKEFSSTRGYLPNAELAQEYPQD